MALHGVLEPSYLYRNYLKQLPSLDFLNDFEPHSGAVGPNSGWAKTDHGTPNVRAQEIGELLICKALALHDVDDLTSGLRILSFGFDMQNSDGSFPGHPGEKHSHVVTAFFLCAAASSLLMLRHAGSTEYERAYGHWLQGLERGATYLAENEADHPELSNTLCAAAAGAALVSAVAPDKGLVDAATRLCEVALLAQSPDGNWPERGGTDTLYQCISLIYGTYALLSCADQSICPAERKALDSGFNWLAERIGNDGSIDCTRNTRKTLDKLPPDNEAIYEGDFVNADYAFRMWGDITGEARWTALADRVRRWIRRSRPGVPGSSWDEKLSNTP